MNCSIFSIPNNYRASKKQLFHKDNKTWNHHTFGRITWNIKTILSHIRSDSHRPSPRTVAPVLLLFRLQTWQSWNILDWSNWFQKPQGNDSSWPTTQKCVRSPNPRGFGPSLSWIRCSYNLGRLLSQVFWIATTFKKQQLPSIALLPCPVIIILILAGIQWPTWMGHIPLRSSMYLCLAASMSVLVVALLPLGHVFLLGYGKNIPKLSKELENGWLANRKHGENIKSNACTGANTSLVMLRCYLLGQLHHQSSFFPSKHGYWNHHGCNRKLMDII